MSNAEQHFRSWVNQLSLDNQKRTLLTPLFNTPDRILIFLFEECLINLNVDKSHIGPRILPLVLHQLIIHLADDIADNECVLFEEPVAQGVTVQYLLSNWFALSLVDSPYEKAHLKAFHQRLEQVGLGQLRELATTHWTLELSKSIGKQLNGSLYGAYFNLAFSGTPLEQQALTIGEAFGIATHIATDIKSNDIRYTHLDAPEQMALRKWALENVSILLDESFQTLEPLKRYARSLLTYLL